MQENQVEQLLDSVQISDVIGKYLDLIPKGNDFLAICPFHNDTKPSMSISNSKKIYKCFACGEGGNAITFLKKYKNITFPEALKELAEHSPLDIKINVSKEIEQKRRAYKINEDALAFFEVALKYSVEGQEALDYLEKRSLTQETIDHFKIGYAPKTKNVLKNNLNDKKILDIEMINLGLIGKKNDDFYYDVFQDRIIFTIHNHIGEVVGFSGRTYQPNDKGAKYINTKETSIFKKNEILYNFFQAKEEIIKYDEIYILEGFMDVIQLVNNKIYNCVATMGTALTANHIEEILKVTKNVTLLFDGDDAGLRATQSAIAKLGNANVRIVILPKNTDPDEFIIKFGRFKFIEYLDKNKLTVDDFNYKMLFYNLDLSNIDAVNQKKNEIFQLFKTSNLSDDQLNIYLKRVSQDLKINYEALFNDYFQKNVKTSDQNKYAKNLTEQTTTKNLSHVKDRYNVAEHGLIKNSYSTKVSYFENEKFMQDRFVNKSSYIIRKALNHYYSLNNEFDYDIFVKSLDSKVKSYFDDFIYSVDYPSSKKYILDLQNTFNVKFTYDKIASLERILNSNTLSNDDEKKYSQQVLKLKKLIRIQEKK